MENCNDAKNDLPGAAAPEGKKKKRLLLWSISGALLLLLLLIAGSALGVFFSFTEKRAPFPEVPGLDAIEQARLMMKVARIIKKEANKGTAIPETIKISFSPAELQSITKLISAFGVREEKWGRIFFKMDYLPEKRAFHGKSILHINKPFLRGRQIIADMIFQLKLEGSEPVIRILSLSIGRKHLSGFYPELEEKLKDSIRSALAKKDVHKFVTSFHIGENGNGELILSVKKFLSGPGKMLLYL